MTPEPTTDPLTAMAEALVEVRERITPVVEAVEGYRQSMEAEGYAPDQARAMAVDYHRFLTTMILR